VLGGGFVPGSSILLVGQPGIGKSTFVIQMLSKLDIPSLYVTGEESVDQLKLRADRLKIHSKDIYLLFRNHVNKVVSHAETIEIQSLVIDSIQTIYTDTSILSLEVQLKYANVLMSCGVQLKRRITYSSLSDK